MEALASALGGTAQVFISSERLLLTMLSGQTFRTKVGSPVRAIGVNLDRLGALEVVAREIEQGRVGVIEAEHRIDAIEAAPALHPAWLIITAMALTAACLARLFGAEWPVVAAAFLAGVANTVLRRLLGRWTWNPVAAAFATALVSGLVGALALKTVPDVDPTLCLVAAGMILVPGVPLINGVADMVGGHIGTGWARLAAGTITVVAISFGLFLAAAAAGDLLPVSQSPGLLPAPEDFLFSAIAAFSFAMLFNVPMRSVWACVTCGMISHGLRTTLESFGVDVATATFLCAAIAGGLARWFGQRLRAPWSTFAFPGVVAMIPGSYAFRAGVGALEIIRQASKASSALVAETLSLAIATAVITTAVAIGLLIASAIHLPAGGFRHRREGARRDADA